CRNRVVHHGERKLGPADCSTLGPETCERLRRSSFVDEMAVDVNERRLARLFVDNVIFPDFFVESLRRHSGSLRILALPCHGANREIYPLADKKKKQIPRANPALGMTSRKAFSNVPGYGRRSISA